MPVICRIGSLGESEAIEGNAKNPGPRGISLSGAGERFRRPLPVLRGISLSDAGEPIPVAAACFV